MDYYKQGDADKAEQIKAAFEKLGYDTRNLRFISSQLYYTIEGKVELMCTKALQNLIKTHPDYKELELPVKPKFKVGDEIAWIGAKGSKPTEPVKIIKLIDKDQLYMVDMSNGVSYVAYDMQEHYELVQKPHYDISNFHAGMPVLVRDYDKTQWRYVQFSHCVGKDNPIMFNACGNTWEQCIPFEGNEHLLGTTDMCDEMYINW